MTGMAVGVDLDVQHLPRDDAVVAGGGSACVLNRVFEVEQHSGALAGIALVDQHGTAAQEVAVALQRHVERRIQQRMAGADVGRERAAGWGDQHLVERDPLVSRQDGLADANDAVAVSDRRRNVGDLEAVRFALLHRATEALERLEEERLDVERLQLARLGALHVLADPADTAAVHRVGGQRMVLDQVDQALLIDGPVDLAGEPGPHLRLVAIADGFDQEFLERPTFEHQLAENVEDPAAHRLSCLLDLLQQALVDVTFARALRHEVPQVADLRLPDPVDAPEALLQPVGVPREIVVDHEVRTLEVDALAGGVRGQQHLDLGVGAELALRGQPILPAHAAVNAHHRLLRAEQRLDLALQVVERVLLLGEDDELLVRRALRSLDVGPRARRGVWFGGGFGDCGAREDLAQLPGQLPPLAVLVRVAHRVGERLQSLERLDLRLELDDRARGGRLVEDLLLGGGDLVIRGLFEVLDVLLVELAFRHRRELARPLHRLHLAQAAFEALSAPAQRLVDRLGRRGEAPLQDREREADGAGALLVLKGLGPVELLAHVRGDLRVKASLLGGQMVGDRIGDALREERCPVELEQALLRHPAHEVGDVDCVRAVAEPALEPVAVQQRHEELEVLFLAVVRRGRHQQEVARQRGEALPEAVSLGVLDLAAEKGGGHLVCLVADDEVPAAVGCLQLELDVLVAGELVEAGDDERRFEEPVAGPRRFELVVGQDLERQVEAPEELVLPLLGETSGANDQASQQIAAGDKLLDEQARHDRLARAGVVG